jgi:hypothetical protein
MPDTVEYPLVCDFTAIIAIFNAIIAIITMEHGDQNDDQNHKYYAASRASLDYLLVTSACIA